MKFKILITLLILFIYGVLASGSDDGTAQQKETLKRATEKSAVGAPLTNEEKSTLNSYKKWEKEYDVRMSRKK